MWAASVCIRHKSIQKGPVLIENRSFFLVYREFVSRSCARYSTSPAKQSTKPKPMASGRNTSAARPNTRLVNWHQVHEKGVQAQRGGPVAGGHLPVLQRGLQGGEQAVADPQQ